MSEEQSKFTGVLAKLKQRPIEPHATVEPASPQGTQVRGRGRPPGKRSDPDYQPTTVLIRKQTKRTASRMLEDINAGQDLSDLIEQLLGEWIQKHA
jgi:hypothetical protein